MGFDTCEATVGTMIGGQWLYSMDRPREEAERTYEELC